jgi:hypothetical protein
MASAAAPSAVATLRASMVVTFLGSYAIFYTTALGQREIAPEIAGHPTVSLPADFGPRNRSEMPQPVNSAASVNRSQNSPFLAGLAPWSVGQGAGRELKLRLPRQ